MKKKTKIIILSVIALLIVIGITFFLGSTNHALSNVFFTEKITVTDGVATPKTSSFPFFSLEKDGTYTFYTEYDAKKPGLITGIVITDESENIVFSSTAESCTLASAPLELKKGDYNYTLYFLANENALEDFLEYTNMTLENDENLDTSLDYDFASNGEWEITYNLRIEPQNAGLHIGIICGVLIGLIFIVILLTITKKDDSIRCKYDERQELARGRGFKYAFFTMLICNFIVFLLNLIEMLPFADISTWIILICLLSIAVYVCYCIWNDAYWALNENRKSLMIFFAIMTIYNLALGISSFVNHSAYQDGQLTFHSINLFCGIMCLVIFATMFLKKICTDGKDE